MAPLLMLYRQVGQVSCCRGNGVQGRGGRREVSNRGEEDKDRWDKYRKELANHDCNKY